MNIYFIIGMITAIALVIGAWRLYRWYKNTGRICPICGNHHVKRPSFIELPQEELGLSFPFIVRKDSLPPRQQPVFLTMSRTVRLVSERSYRKAISLCIHWIIQTAVWIVVARIFRGWPRWYIWGALCYTFSDCPPCARHDCRRIKLVRMKFKDDPVTLWHLWWTKRHNPEQFQAMPMEFKLAIDDAIKPVYHAKPTRLPTDMPEQPDLISPLIEEVKEMAEAIITDDKPPRSG